MSLQIHAVQKCSSHLYLDVFAADIVAILKSLYTKILG